MQLLYQTARRRVDRRIPPGGGKTILALAVLDALYKAGRIDAALVLTPRLGLCSQFELDWKAVRNAFQPNALGAISWGNRE
ncbi:MAG: DEAD/DEAH box helicase family protein [Caldilineaceae bacterium]